MGIGPSHVEWTTHWREGMAKFEGGGWRNGCERRVFFEFRTFLAARDGFGSRVGGLRPVHFLPAVLLDFCFLMKERERTWCAP